MCRRGQAVSSQAVSSQAGSAEEGSSSSNQGHVQMHRSSAHNSPPAMKSHLADEASPDLLLHESSCRSPRLRRLHIVGVKAWRLGSTRGPRRQALLRRVVARLWRRRIRCARSWRLRIEALLIWRICAVAPRAGGRHGLLRGRVAGGVACKVAAAQVDRRCRKDVRSV